MNLLKIQRGLSGVLRPASSLYGFIMAVRRRLWEKDTLKRLDPPCPCVSVGNISWGGTGKTPIVDWILSRSANAGLRTVVLTRGYKAHVSRPPVLVTSQHSPRDVGDEPLMLALHHPHAAIVVDPDRRRSGSYAISSLTPDMLVLDDGFQHLTVKRHLDMVLLRPEDLDDQWNRVIPGGSWRENISALHHADVLCIKATEAQFGELLPAMHKKLRQFEKPVFSFTLKPVQLTRIDETGTATPAAFGGRPYALVTGVGHPEQVLHTVTAYMGYEPEHHLMYPDHHDYEFRDAKKLTALQMPILCTAKDEVKLRRMPVPQLWCVRVAAVFGPCLWSRDPFPEWWDRWLAEVSTALSLPAFEKPSLYFVPDDGAVVLGLQENTTHSPEGEAIAKAVREQARAQAPEHMQEQPPNAPPEQPEPPASPPPPINWATPPRPRHTPEPECRRGKMNITQPPRPKLPTIPGH